MTREEFLKLYCDLKIWKEKNFNNPQSNLAEAMTTANPEIFNVHINQIHEFFPDKWDTLKCYKNIHGNSRSGIIKVYIDFNSHIGL